MVELRLLVVVLRSEEERALGGAGELYVGEDSMLFVPLKENEYFKVGPQLDMNFICGSCLLSSSKNPAMTILCLGASIAAVIPASASPISN